MTVPLSGSGESGSPVLSLTPASVGFGEVAVGSSATRTFEVANTGTAPLTITKAKAPASVFTSAAPLAEGLVLNPGQSVPQPVTFRSTAAGTATAVYEVTSDDGRGAQRVTFTGTGVAAPGAGGGAGTGALAAPTGDAWARNGSARVSGADVVLTPAVADQAGWVVHRTAVPTEGLRVRFTAEIGGGTGADGLTFSLLDPARSEPTALGRGGGGLGYGTFAGVAVTLDTYQNGGDPGAGFVGIATGARGSAADELVYAGTAPVPGLRTGSHVVEVAVAGGRIVVRVDGVQRLDAAVAVPARALPAFTAGTGGATDVHTVRAVSIRPAGATPPPVPPVPPVPALPGPTAAGWARTGSATLSGADLVLTPAAGSVSGSSFYGTAVPTAGLKARFTASIAGGSGADGLTFALLDASAASVRPTALGRGGGALGFGGLPGVAVALDTHPNPGDPSTGFVGVSAGGEADRLTWAATAPGAALRGGPHVVEVEVTAAKRVLVSVDGVRLVDVAVPSLPSSALVGFTAATGGLTDVHTVRQVTFTRA